ncbi:hypothetical protein Tco_1062093 [Tanacetum coccineum]
MTYAGFESSNEFGPRSLGLRNFASESEFSLGENLLSLIPAFNHDLAVQTEVGIRHSTDKGEWEVYRFLLEESTKYKHAYKRANLGRVLLDSSATQEEKKSYA